MKRLLFAFLLMCTSLVWAAEPTVGTSPRFSVMAYNVENLFDLDEVSLYDDFVVTGASPERWTPEKLASKLGRIAAVLKTSNGGRGPDVLILDELEADHTPGSTLTAEAFIVAQQGKHYRDILKGELPAELAGAPIEAWLLKALEDEGLSGYKVVLGDILDLKQEAIHCAILTRLPIKSVRQHHVQAARTIVEAEVEVGGESVFIFANHWKSGAGSPATETTRLQNASVARARLDEIFKANPRANIVFGGDLNSHYNQKQRYPAMAKTGIQDVLRSQGDPAKLANGSADLYNLWYDVEPSARKSDEFRGEWGTLMHLIVSQGLADGQGLDYVPGSFGAVILPGLNAHTYPVTPWRWTSYGSGAGISDHFPLKAEFTIHPKPTAAPLTRPEFSPSEGLAAFPAMLDVSKFGNAKTIPALSPDETAKQVGEIFVLEGTYNGGAKPSLMIGDKRYSLYVPDEALLKTVKATKKGQAVRWLGQLNFYKGQLEFMVSSPDWLKAR
jgi:endonuclease/exonuclease/phosphatase family metal-dependent hydrolase